MSRALAIARSHADAGVSALLVVASDGHEWVAHRVAGASAESASTVLRGDRATVIGRLSGAASGVDLVVVDAPPQWARTALRTVVSAVGTPRIVAVDPALLQRFGAHRPLPPVATAGAGFVHRRARRWPVGLAAVILVLMVAVGAGLARSRSPSAAATMVGGVRVDVPGDWRRTELTGEPAPRTVFVDPDTGSRIIVAVSPLRGGATTESVAASLAERIRQRGDDAVGEFAVRAQFGGRTVIAYRETPDSGAPIRWYVRVVGVPDRGTVQASIGCQDSGPRGLEAACRRAVGSAGS